MTFSWRVCIFSCSILTADTLWALNQEHLVNDKVPSTHTRLCTTASNSSSRDL